jgi:hypothetical protein
LIRLLAADEEPDQSDAASGQSATRPIADVASIAGLAHDRCAIRIV